MAVSSVDIELRELALTNWTEFKKLTGIDETNFRICQKKKEGKSIRQIAAIVRVGRDRVHRVCKACP